MRVGAKQLFDALQHELLGEVNILAVPAVVAARVAGRLDENKLRRLPVYPVADAFSRAASRRCSRMKSIAASR